jgi:aminoglycoside 3-N-acetyltransferase
MSGPVTWRSIAADLGTCGVSAGDILCAHSSLKSLGFVIGGARAVIEGLLAAVGPKGTVMMPSFSGDLSDPAEWRHPPVPAEWHDEIRRSTPAYDPTRTPTRGMGTVAELFRHWPGATRSTHPQSSFAALGPAAAQLVSPHPLDRRFGPDGPLGRLVELGGRVVLIGAPDDTASLFHLTQHLVGWSTNVRKSAPVLIDGEPRWTAYDDIEYPVDWFKDGLAFLLAKGCARQGRVGEARTILFEARTSVEALVDWRRIHRR